MKSNDPADRKRGEEDIPFTYFDTELITVTRLYLQGISLNDEHPDFALDINHCE